MRGSFLMRGGVILLVALLGACRGPAGADGADGEDGEDGKKGKNGEDGANGFAGDDGDDGDDGDPGPAGPPGQDAMVDPGLTPLQKAFAGVGGEAALTALTGFELVTSGTTGAAGEGFTPADFLPVVTTFDATVAGDLAGDAWRIDVARDNYFFGFPAPATFSEVIDGDVGEIVGIESILGFPSVMPSDRWASIRRNQRFLNPHLLLRELQANPALASDGGVQLLDGSVHHLLVVEDDVAPITLWINAGTGRIAKLATTENDPAYSDVAVEVFYYAWMPTDGALWFPSEVYVAVDGDIIRSEIRASAAENPVFPATHFDLVSVPVPFDQGLADRGDAEAQFHQEFAGVGIPSDGPRSLTATELSPGIWHLTSESHHSMVVEQAAGLVMFDAPWSVELATDALSWAAFEFPGKPVTHVVASHFHRDHVAGLRALVAAGATVVVHESTVPYYQDLFTRARTVRPDALAANPVPATIEVVPDGGVYSLPDATHPVDVLSIATGHAADFVVPYLPADELAFSVDIYSPGFGVNAFGLDLYAGLTTQHPVTVSTIAGGHGFGTATWAGFEGELVAAGLLVP